MKRDAVLPCVMAVVMMIFFTYMSEGLSLVVTFVVAVPVALWLYFQTCYRQSPDPDQVMLLYLLGLGFQFLHFAEEHAFGFDRRFGLLFHGQPYNHNLFVTFNMCAYFTFILGGIGFYRNIKPLMFIAMFFIVYGMIGNAIGHIGFCLASGGYFPGIYTCFLNVLPGIWLIRTLWRSRGSLKELN